MPWWWERSEKRKMSRLVGADKKAVLTQLSSRYNRGEEKSSSKSVFSDACAVKKSCWRPDLPVWLISILVPLVTLSRSLIKLASKSENTETIIKTHGQAKTSYRDISAHFHVQLCSLLDHGTVHMIWWIIQTAGAIWKPATVQCKSLHPLWFLGCRQATWKSA